MVRHKDPKLRKTKFNLKKCVVKRVKTNPASKKKIYVILRSHLAFQLDEKYWQLQLTGLLVCRMDPVNEVSLLTHKQDKLHPTQLLVSILQPTTPERNPTSLYTAISELLVFRKRVNETEVDALQIDICAYKPYEFTKQ